MKQEKSTLKRLKALPGLFRKQDVEKITPHAALFFGLTHQERFYMASPEKAILYTFYYRRTIPAHDELEFEEIDFGLLTESAKRYPQSVSRLIPSRLKERLI